MAFRVDAGSTSFQGPTKTSQGFWRVTAPVARAGVYRYPQPDGSVRLELRPEEEVFSPASLRSYEAAPITSGHPKELDVTPRNVKTLKVGTVMGPGRRVDGDVVAAPLSIEDETAIREAKTRQRNQLSPGYRIDLEETPGVHPKYGEYHAIQRNIRVNHLALVRSARGGEDLQIRMDGLDETVIVGVRVDHDVSAAQRRGAMQMDYEEQIRLLKSQLEEATRLNQTRQDAAEEAQRRADMASAATGPLNERIRELEQIIAEGATTVETEALTRERRRADDAEEAVRRFDERFEDGVRRRSQLMHRAALVMGTAFRMDDLTERQIHEAVVRRLDSKATFKDQSDAFVAGRFEALIDLRNRTAQSLHHLTDHITSDPSHRRADEAPAVDKAQRMRDFRNQWRKPLPNDIRAQREGK